MILSFLSLSDDFPFCSSGPSCVSRCEMGLGAEDYLGQKRWRKFQHRLDLRKGDD